MNTFPPVLRFSLGDEIEVRGLEHSHAQSLFELVDANRVYLRQWLPWLDANTSVKDTQNFIQMGQETLGNNRGFDGGIWHRGQLAGVISVKSLDWSSNKALLGYWIGEPSQGQGLVTRSCRELITFLFEHLGLKRVEIHCATENRLSRAIPERLDFVQEGLLQRVEWLYDHYVDHVIYRMLAEEWNPTGRGR